mgnify:CR=1 FL=1
MTNKPTVLFVCVHNAGRSQMAAGFMREIGQGRDPRGARRARVARRRDGPAPRLPSSTATRPRTLAPGPPRPKRRPREITVRLRSE